MKSIFYTVLCLVFLLPLNTVAQKCCGTNFHDGLEIMARTKANKKALKQRDPNRSMVTKYVPLKFHLTAENDGSSRIKVSSVLDQLCRLQEDYTEVEMIFYLNDLFSYVDNNGVFFDPIGNFNQIVDLKDDNSLNIFITENASTGSTGGTTLGFYNPSGDYIITRKAEIVSISATNSHEIGHFFSLNHPFFGWEIPGNRTFGYSIEEHGNPLTVTETYNGFGIELVDGSNCDDAGDLVCDTPPDFNFPFSNPTDNVDGPCQLLKPIFDNNTDEVKPMADNYMGYFGGCSSYQFSPDQIQLMDEDFFSSARNFLRSDYVPVLDEITETPEILTPSSAATTDFYNSVEVSWTAVDGAQYYLVEFTDSSGDAISYITEETSILVTDLAPDNTYFWTLRPFNETFACASNATNQRPLFTNSDVTSVNELSFVSGLKVVPNPVQQNTDININMESAKTFEGQVELNDLSGKNIISQQNIFKAGANSINLATSQLTSGMYILNISTEEGIITEKIIIE